MSSESEERLNAKFYSKIERIQKTEKKIKATSFVPSICLCIAILLSFTTEYLVNGNGLNVMSAFLFASVNIAVVGHALMKRADLLIQLEELKREQ